MSFLPSLTGQLSRLGRRAWNNQGFITNTPADELKNVYRDPALDMMDAYYENRQYDALLPWSTKENGSGEVVALRAKKPLIVMPFARGLSSIVTAKLIGPTVFPNFKVEGYPDEQEYWKLIAQVSQLQMFLLEPIRRMVNCGEVFVRFYIAGGAFKKEMYDAKFCYPTFDDAGELEEITIKYIFSDESDRDTNGKPKRKWFRMDLGKMAETMFDSPDYKEGEEPEFTAIETVEHGFDFVQGQWFTSTGAPKGYGLVKDITGFIDEMCYSISQSSKAVSYNQDPQLTLQNLTEDEMSDLMRSSERAWLLGRTGEAKFLESNLAGVERAIELRDKVTQNISLLTRVVMLDPEKIVGSAQSAKAMEVLHGPLKDLIDELRLPIGQGIRTLVMKMGAANFLLQARGEEMVPLPLPEGFQFKTLMLEIKWPAIFQATLEDLQKKVQTASQALTSGVISPRTAIKFVAEDFGIEDVDAELAEIAQHQKDVAALNPFGGF